MDSLRRHPFPVVAHFDKVVALSYAFPKDVLRPLLPCGLEIDTFEGLGFVTVALVWTSQLRPAGFPAFLGQDFFLAGYRIFARLRDQSGRRLRGLRILRSETDQRRMVWAGNLLTRYRYRHVRVRVDGGAQTRVRTSLANGTQTLDLTFGKSLPDTPLPAVSPFPDWHTARRFSGPMPFTFSPEGNRDILVIQGSRTNWVPRPIPVASWQVSLFDEPPFRDSQPILANAFAVEDVAYRWQKGRMVSPLAS